MPRHPGPHGAFYEGERRYVLAQSTTCHLCGHPGAAQVDHYVSRKEGLAAGWTERMLDDRSNLRPVHGSDCHCPTCGLACNQTRKAKPIVERYQSRRWR